MKSTSDNAKLMDLYEKPAVAFLELLKKGKQRDRIGSKGNPPT